jgi:uncharacterized protein YecA (UPF0149 family)
MDPTLIPPNHEVYTTPPTRVYSHTETVNAPTAEFVTSGYVQLYKAEEPAPKKWPKATPVRRRGMLVGRNATCPCGSGLKFKRCHAKESR